MSGNISHNLHFTSSLLLICEKFIDRHLGGVFCIPFTKGKLLTLLKNINKKNGIVNIILVISKEQQEYLVS